MHTFLIFLGLAFAMVLGQVLMLRPGAEDKRLMQLRDAARQQGFQVRLVPPPAWLRLPDGARLVACYTVFVDEGATFLPAWRVEQREGEWLTRVGDAGLLARLSLPPEAASVLALEAGANAVHLYWSETLAPGSLPPLFFLLRQVIEKAIINQ